jgi:hypothetical protein
MVEIVILISRYEVGARKRGIAARINLLFFLSVLKCMLECVVVKTGEDDGKSV